MIYSSEQDRILLRISTAEKSEYQLWLTRRFIKILWGALMTTMEKDTELEKDLIPEVHDAMLAMQHQEALQTINFNQTHAEDNRDLTSNTGPLLIKGGTLAAEGPRVTGLNLNLENNMAVKVSLNNKLMHAFCHMTSSTYFRAEWELSMAVGDPSVISSDRTKVH